MSIPNDKFTGCDRFAAPDSLITDRMSDQELTMLRWAEERIAREEEDEQEPERFDGGPL